MKYWVNKVSNFISIMVILIFLSFLVAIAFMVGLDIVLFMEDTLYGIGGIIGMLGFFIAYAISVDMIIAPRDFWFQSSWQIFCKKMGYAFTTYLIVTLIAAGILVVFFG